MHTHQSASVCATNSEYVVVYGRDLKASNEGDDFREFIHQSHKLCRTDEQKKLSPFRQLAGRDVHIPSPSLDQGAAITIRVAGLLARPLHP